MVPSVNVLASLKLKIDANCGDPKLLVNAMKSCLRVEDLNTNDCFFWRTLSYMDLPSGSLICRQMRITTHIDPTTMNYLMLCPNTEPKRACIK